MCGRGNSLALLKAEELRLLICGSEEALDVAALRAVARHEGWDQDDDYDAGQEVPRVAAWFWRAFGMADPQAQRRLLHFVTSSDRLPALGQACLSLRIICQGPDEGRYPVARTCFNALMLCRYSTPARLEYHLWEAVYGSPGFGLR